MKKLMIPTPPQASAPSSLWRALRAGLIALCLLATAAQTGAYTGAIFTTDSSGTAVNANIYTHKEDVYLNGGPQNKNAAGLPDGDYYFQVTDPSGVTLLSTDNVECRRVTVLNERFAGPSILSSCPHKPGTPNINNGATGVQLIPFLNTPNAGGEYKVWLVPVSKVTIVLDDHMNPTIMDFSDKDAKTDNFKIKDPGACLIVTLKDVTLCGTESGFLTAVTQPANGNFSYVWSKDGTTIDGQNGASLPVTEEGMYTVIVTDKDKANCTDTATATVTIDPECIPPHGCLCPLPITVCAKDRDDLTKTGMPACTSPDNDCGVPTYTDDPESIVDSCTKKFTRNWTCHFGNGITTTCKQEITIIVDDKGPTPNTTPTALVEVQCASDVPPAGDLTANDNCDSSTIKASAVPTGPFADQDGSCGYTLVRTWTLTDKCGNSTVVVQKVHVKDTTKPTIAPADPITRCLTTTKGTVIPNFPYPAVSDNCDLDTLTAVPTRSDDPKLTLNDPFPCGQTTITWNAKDSCGNVADPVTQTVTITGGTICATKFYDADKNPLNDKAPAIVAGWKITLTGTDSGGNSYSSTLTTDGNGVACFSCVPLGSYTVAEVLPPATTSQAWISTTATSLPVSVTDCVKQDVAFHNYCQRTPGGLTIGFWSNKNGQSLESDADFVTLTGMNLRNGKTTSDAGSAQDFVDTLTKNRAAFSTWLLSANANNMAYMLSAQLAATKLNVLHNVTDPTVVVDGTKTVSDLIIYANTLLGNTVQGYSGNGWNTIATSALRTEQDRVKTILDAINNGKSFVQPTPCSVTYK